jgi:hypothetical protein
MVIGSREPCYGFFDSIGEFYFVLSSASTYETFNLSRQSRNQTRSLVPKLRLGILKLEAPASRLFLWHWRERTEPVGKQSFLCWVSPSGAWETAKSLHDLSKVNCLETKNLSWASHSERRD